MIGEPQFATRVDAIGASRQLSSSRTELVFASIAAAILLVSAVLWADRPPTNEMTDFSVTYTGSRMVYLGLGTKLYDLDQQRTLKRTLLPHAEPLIFEHPPFEALLLAPLGALPYKTAYLLWGLINVAIWLFLPYLLRPYAPVPRDDLAYALLWLLFAPPGITLFQGQSSLIVLLLYSLCFVAWKQGRDFRAGVLLGLGLFKFQFVLPFVLVFLLLRKWRFMQGFSLSAIVLALLSLLAVGWQGIRAYIQLLMHVSAGLDNQFYGSSFDMPTVSGFVHSLLGTVAGATTMSWIVAAITAGLIVLTVWYWKKVELSTAASSHDLMFAATIVVSLVAGMHMFMHDLSPLILALLLIAARWREGMPVIWRPILRASIVLFWIVPLYFLLVAWHRGYLLFPVLMFLLAGILATVNNRLVTQGLPPRD
jgi:hypothetical protein